jgi:hypothetical protein
MRWLRHFPFKTGLVVGFLSFLIIEKPPGGTLQISLPEADDLQKYRTEFYPLSAFPMYAEFSDAPIITFYTNEKDEPIPFNQLTSSGATAAKKDYYGLLKEVWQKKKPKGKGLKISDAPLEIKQEAGKQALQDFLLTRAATWSAANPDQILRLYEGVIRKQPGGGKPVFTKTLTAEASRNSLTTTAP